MDPLTLTALVSLVGKGIQLGQQYSNVVWSNDGWHGLSQAEKYETVKAVLKVSFDKAPELQQTPKQIFWEIMLQSIHRPAEKNYETFINKNTWIVTGTEYVPAFERQYGYSFTAVPAKTNALTSLFSNKTISIYIAAVLAIIILIFIFK